MSDDRTLTDEELAQWTSLHQPEGEAEGTYCRCCRRWWPCPEAKLIAALRASREEVERLTQAVAVANARAESSDRMYDIAKARADAAEAKLSGHYRANQSTDCSANCSTIGHGTLPATALVVLGDPHRCNGPEGECMGHWYCSECASTLERSGDEVVHRVPA